MKYCLALLITLFSFTSMAQPFNVPVNNYGKGVSGVSYRQLIGADYLVDWKHTTEARDYPYKGGTITVQYPILYKEFTFNYKGELADGKFVIDYNRHNGQGFLKFAFYLYWQDGRYSYFIGKKYGLNNEVTFYESGEISGITYDPKIPFGQEFGTKVWRFEVVDFANLVPDFYDAFLKGLEEETWTALNDAVNAANP